MPSRTQRRRTQRSIRGAQLSWPLIFFSQRFNHSSRGIWRDYCMRICKRSTACPCAMQMYFSCMPIYITFTPSRGYNEDIFTSVGFQFRRVSLLHALLHSIFFFWKMHSHPTVTTTYCALPPSRGRSQSQSTEQYQHKLQ